MIIRQETSGYVVKWAGVPWVKGKPQECTG